MDNCKGQPLFEGMETNKGLVVKKTAYQNHWAGITEPQREVVRKLASGKGNFLVEAETMRGRKMYKCFDVHKNPIGTRFSRVVVKNLVSKGYLVEHNSKFYLK